jgi:hypothetical protein
MKVGLKKSVSLIDAGTYKNNDCGRFDASFQN